MKKPLNLLIFDDSDEMRESLEWLVGRNPDLQLLGVYAHVNNIEAVLNTHQPDVILMDIQMPGRSGIEALEIIKSQHSDIQVIMLSNFEEEQYIFQSIQKGASGYLIKSMAMTELMPALETVMSNGSPLSPRIARTILDHFQKIKIAPDYSLSPREHEVLTHLTEGKATKTIAAQLFLSELTVSNHIRNIYRKLHVHSRSEAVAKALKENLVQQKD